MRAILSFDFNDEYDSKHLSIICESLEAYVKYRKGYIKTLKVDAPESELINKNYDEMVEAELLLKRIRKFA